MMKTVLWVAAACAAVLVALAVSRGLHFDRPAPQPAAPTAAVAPPAAPAVAVAPEVAPAPPPPPPPAPTTAEDQQIQDDAAATGMTTVEPDQAAPADTPPT